MSKIENDTLGNIVKIGSLLTADPAVSIKKPPGKNEIIRKKANQK
jgi:hypothetical protein